jgi:hypothetical protein
MRDEKSYSSSSEASAAFALLHDAYRDAVDAGMIFPQVASRWRLRRLGNPICIPRVGGRLLRFFLILHIRSKLNRISKALRDRRVRHAEREGDEDILKSVDELKNWLPTSLLKASTALFFITTAVFALAFGLVILSSKMGLPKNTTSDAKSLILDGRDLYKNKSIKWAEKFWRDFSTASPIARRFTEMIVGASFYVVFWPLASLIRLKRLFFNYYPYWEEDRPSTELNKNEIRKCLRKGLSEKMRYIPASWSVTQSVGIYKLERNVFSLLDIPARQELPLDLTFSALPPMALIVAFAALLTHILQSPGLTTSDRYIFSIEVVLFLLPAFLRLGWLVAAGLSRCRLGRRVRRNWLLGKEVRVRLLSKKGAPQELSVRCRSPLIIGLINLILLYPFLSPIGAAIDVPKTFSLDSKVFLALLLLVLPVSFPLVGWPWRSTARDLRDLGRTLDVKRLRRIHPWIQGLLVLSPAFLITLFRAPGLVRDAQQAVGLRRPVTRKIAWLAPIWPLQCILLQRELNRLWQYVATHPIEVAESAAAPERQSLPSITSSN